MYTEERELIASEFVSSLLVPFFNLLKKLNLCKHSSFSHAINCPGILTGSIMYKTLKVSF